MLISYKIKSGIPSKSWLVIFGLGVSIPASKRIITIACFLYLLMNFGVNIPSFDKKNEIIGSSKTTPAASITDKTKLKYSSTAILFVIACVPKAAKNFNAVGSITKYANDIPPRKQIEEKITIDEIYLRSEGSSPGSMNFHNW